MNDKDFVDLQTLVPSNGAMWGTETEDLDATLVSWAAGKGVAAHTNREVDVVMVVLEGRGRVQRGEEILEVEKGQVVVFPKGIERSITADDRLTYLNVHKRRKRLMPNGIRPPKP